MTKSTYNTIINAMYMKDIHDNEGNTTKTIPVYKEELPENIKNYLFSEIQVKESEEDCIPFEQSFSIMYDALALFQDVEFKDLEEFDPLEVGDGIASIYYGEQLEYLNAHNMYAITDILKEYDCDSIADACAIWYETTVKDWALIIKNYIMNN